MIDNTTLQDDTIVAISTPHGVGGIAVIRVSGKDAVLFVSRCWHGKPIEEMKSHTAHFGRITDAFGEVLDEDSAANCECAYRLWLPCGFGRRVHSQGVCQRQT